MTITLENASLPVLIFLEGIQRGIGMTDLAKEAGLNIVTLNNYLKGDVVSPRTETAEKIAKLLRMSVDDVTERAKYRTLSMREFPAWLREQMAGKPRTREAKALSISDSTMKNYLEGETLPDSKQASKIAAAYRADPLEIAAMIISERIRNANGTLAMSMAQIAPRFAQPPAPVVAAQPAVEAAQSIESAESTVADTVKSPHLSDEQKFLDLWKRLHPQGRRAAINYMADLLAAL